MGMFCNLLLHMSAFMYIICILTIKPKVVSQKTVIGKRGLQRVTLRVHIKIDQSTTNTTLSNTLFQWNSIGSQRK